MSHIHKLPQDVINRIAAGEVVQRPSAALKELLENALDAGSSTIQVTTQDGGLEVLQVCDDGCGIDWEDLPLLCERYATSKLSTFDDLQSITSFGFRGEALASLSYVAKVTVTTKRRASRPPTTTAATEETSSSAATTRERPSHQGEVAWRATYLDGQLTQPPQACAGNFGSVIRAERMFYNAAVRRGALRSSEEWSRVVDVVSRYALAFPHVGFSCTRETGSGASGHHSSSGGVVFPKGSDTLKNLRISHGNTIASHLHPIYHYDASVEARMPPLTTPSASPSSASHVEVFSRVSAASKHVQGLRGAPGEGIFTISGFASDSTLLNRKSYQCLFINNRLVESYAIRKCVDAVYSAVLTGGNKPFVVLFVTVPSERLDVNVHPTKKEVCLLDEDLIIAKLSELLRACVLQAASARQLDMLKLQNTTAAALKAFHPHVASSATLPLPLSSSASAQQTLDMLHTNRHTNDGDDPKSADVDKSQSETVRGRTSSSTAILSTLHDQAARGVGPSPLTSNSLFRSSLSQASGGSVAGLGKGNGGVVIAPCTIVRVEEQKGALDAFFSKVKTTPSTVRTSEKNIVVDDDDDDGEVTVVTPPSTTAATTTTTADDTARTWQNVMASIRPVAGPSSGYVDEVTEVAEPYEKVARSESELREAAASSTRPDATVKVPGALMLDEEDSEDEKDKDALLRDFQRFREHGSAPFPADETTDLMTGPAASSAPFARPSVHTTDDEKAAEGGEDGPGRPSSSGTMPQCTSLVVGVPEVETQVLTSVAAVVAGLHARSSAAAQAFFSQLAFVGVVDANAFLAQSGTSLYLLDTLRLLREVVFQRLFLRWADPGLPRMAILHLSAPPSVETLLLFALAHDAEGMDALTSVPPALREAAAAARQETQRRKRRRGSPETGTAVVPSTDLSEGASTNCPAAAERRRHVESLLQAAAYRVHNSDGGKDVSATDDHETADLSVSTQSCAALAACLFTPQTAQKKMSSRDTRHEPDTTEAVAEAETPTPTRSARRYVRRLARRLGVWRDMLSEYFDVVLSADGHVLSLPYVLNTSWPPNLRALPLFLWLLAEGVPFPTSASASHRAPKDRDSSAEKMASRVAADPSGKPPASPASLSPTWRSSPPSSPSSLTQTQTQSGLTHGASEAAQAVEEEVQCFTAIAKHIADTLYGLTSLPTTVVTNNTSLTESQAAQEQHARDSAGWPLLADFTIPSAQEGVEMALMPCLRSTRLFYPPAVLLSDGTLQSIISVESLYKVFERC